MALYIGILLQEENAFGSGTIILDQFEIGFTLNNVA